MYCSPLKPTIILKVLRSGKRVTNERAYFLKYDGTLLKNLGKHWLYRFANFFTDVSFSSVYWCFWLPFPLMFVAYKFQLLKVSELLVAYQSFSDWNEGSEFKDQQDQKFTYMDQRRSKDQRSTCFTDQQIKVHQRSRFNKIKDQENQPEINFFQITDQKFKVQLFTDQITKLDLVRRKPILSKNIPNTPFEN